MSRAKVLQCFLGVLCLVSSAAAQPVITPPQVVIPPSSPVCAGGSEAKQVCITLPPQSLSSDIDVLFLLDDTSSFGLEPAMGVALIDAIQAAYPGVTFGFGVARFEDYGGPGADFGGLDVDNRPFILNQPIVTAAVAGTPAALSALIGDALNRTAPGFGGDEPESAIAEGLYQAATGAGFDGNGDNSTTGNGGLQPAGALVTQTAPDDSGDVPAFSTLTVPSAGTVGGVGFRAQASKVILLVTDFCSVTAFTGPAFPATVVGTGSTEQVADLACSTTPGMARHGFVSDALSFTAHPDMTLVVPRGAHTVPATITALNAAGIRVIGLSPGGVPKPPGAGASFDPAHYLSAVARLTGAVAANGDALLIDSGFTQAELDAALLTGVNTAVAQPVDITLQSVAPLPAGLSLAIAAPNPVLDVPPAGQACYTLNFSGTGVPNGGFGLRFLHAPSNTLLGTSSVSAQCVAAPQEGALLLSSRCTILAKGLLAQNEDILRFDEATGNYSMFFDGSDVGLLFENVDAFDQLPNGKLILSFSDKVFLPGAGWVEDEDVVLFNPTSLGSNTAGTFAPFFDGSANGISGLHSDIDGVSFADNFLYYTLDSSCFAQGLPFKNEDIVRFDFATHQHLLYFDGSDVGLSLANLDGFELQNNGKILMTFEGTTFVPGVGLVEDEDIVIFTPTSLGQNTSGTFAKFFDGDLQGLVGFQTDVDAVGRQVVP